MDLNVTNILVYVDDAVRAEAVSDRLASLGPTHRTIAASTHTPTSFGSLLTGLLPPRSNILSFKHVVPDTVRSVFDLESHEVSVDAEGGMNHSIAAIFDDPPRRTIDDVTPPFVHVVRRERLVVVVTGEGVLDGGQKQRSVALRRVCAEVALAGPDDVCRWHAMRLGGRPYMTTARRARPAVRAPRGQPG